MNGKVLITALLVPAVVMGAGLWYSIQSAYYEKIEDVTEVTAYGDAFPVSNYQGIDADSSPLKMRACFDVEWDYFPSDEFNTVATPLIAPSFFKCFDAGAITADLQDGNATAILADENEPFGFNTFIAQYPDGRAFMWRQINKCGDAHFKGDVLPDGCPVPDDAIDKNIMRDPNAEIFNLKLSPISNGEPEEMLIDEAPITSYSTDAKLYFACFKTPMSFGLLSETYKIADDALPPRPLSEMACYNQGQIAQDIASGVALSLVGERNIIKGYDRIITVYPDGSAFAWHQKAEK